MAMERRLCPFKWFTLSVYVGLHVALVPVVMDSGVLSPGHVMVSEKGRSWIPMLADPQKALERAKWGAEELGLTVANPKIFDVVARQLYLSTVLQIRTSENRVCCRQFYRF